MVDTESRWPGFCRRFSGDFLLVTVYDFHLAQGVVVDAASIVDDGAFALADDGVVIFDLGRSWIVAANHARVVGLADHLAIGVGDNLDDAAISKSRFAVVPELNALLENAVAGSWLGAAGSGGVERVGDA